MIMRFILHFILTFVLWMMLFPLRAQETTVRGRVMEQRMETPLEAASVVIQGDGYEDMQITEGDGTYRFDGLKPGRYMLFVSLVGYQSRGQIEVIAHVGKESVVDVHLLERVVKLDEVSVTAWRDRHRPTNELAAVSARSFNAEDTRRYAGSLNDPSRMAANFAGISGANDARNDIIIRGNSPSGLLWRFEGVDIPNPNHFGAFGSTGGPVSMLNNNLLGASDFLTGAFPAEYGNALAGSFDLTLRRGNTEKHEFVGQVGYNGFELGAEGPLGLKGKSSYLINYRYSTLALFDLIGLGGFTGTGTAIPAYQDVSFKLYWETEKYGTFEAFGLGGISDIDLAVNEGDSTNFYAQTGRDTYFSSRAGIVGLKHTIRLKGDWQLRSILSANQLQQATRIDSLLPDSDERALFFGDRFVENRYQAHVRLQKKFNAKNFLRIGAIAQHIDFNLRDSVARMGMFFPLRESDGNTQLVQLYGQYQYKFDDQWTLSGGLHGMYLFLNDTYVIEPRASLSYDINSSHALSAAFGRHSQVQSMLSYFYQGRASTELTNLNLGFSRSDHYVLSYSYRPSQLWLIKMEVYYQDLFDIPVSEDIGTFSMINFGADFGIPSVRNLFNGGTGYNTGVEWTIERRFARNFYLLSTTSIFDSRFRGSDGVLRETAFNGNYVTNLLGGYEVSLSAKTLLSVDVRNTLAGGRRMTPIDLEASRQKGEEVLMTDRAYEEQLPTYHRLDVRLTLRINGRKNMQEWFVDFQNVTNRQNPFIRTYNPATEDILTINQLGFLPMFNYRILF